MRRRLFLWIGLIGVVSAWLLGCGGDKGTSTTSKSYIRFENKFDGADELYITIEACHIQNFVLKKGQSATLECVPEDGSTSFLATVVMDWEAPSYMGGYWKQECTVSGGQTVEIKSVGTLATFYLFVDGEIQEG